jgi:hypothetical protein
MDDETWDAGLGVRGDGALDPTGLPDLSAPVRWSRGTPTVRQETEEPAPGDPGSPADPRDPLPSEPDGGGGDPCSVALAECEQEYGRGNCMCFTPPGTACTCEYQELEEVVVQRPPDRPPPPSVPEPPARPTPVDPNLPPVEVVGDGGTACPCSFTDCDAEMARDMGWVRSGCGFLPENGVHSDRPGLAIIRQLHKIVLTDPYDMFEGWLPMPGGKEYFSFAVGCRPNGRSVWVTDRHDEGKPNQLSCSRCHYVEGKPKLRRVACPDHGER